MLVRDYLASFTINIHVISRGHLILFDKLLAQLQDSHDADDNFMLPINRSTSLSLCLFLCFRRVVTHLSGFRACHYYLYRDLCRTVDSVIFMNDTFSPSITKEINFVILRTTPYALCRMVIRLHFRGSDDVRTIISDESRELSRITSDSCNRDGDSCSRKR